MRATFALGGDGMLESDPALEPSETGGHTLLQDGSGVLRPLGTTSTYRSPAPLRRFGFPSIARALLPRARLCAGAQQSRDQKRSPLASCRCSSINPASRKDRRTSQRGIRTPPPYDAQLPSTALTKAAAPASSLTPPARSTRAPSASRCFAVRARAGCRAGWAGARSTSGAPRREPCRAPSGR